MEITEFLKNIMHEIAQGTLLPAIGILLILMLVAIIELGGFIFESIFERRKFSADIPKLLKSINASNMDEIPDLISESGLLKRQRRALMELYDNREMSHVMMEALALRLLTREENRYIKAIEPCNIVAKIAPMLGLLGTLIPLGPGLLALGKGDVELLSQSMLVAFDTTISGIISAGICFVIVTVRKRWYRDYISLLENIMDAVLEKAHPESGYGER